MQIKLFSLIMFFLAIAGCQKQSIDPEEKAQFVKSDSLLGMYLDRLDNPSTGRSEKVKILCKDFSDEYLKNYMPSVLSDETTHHTRDELISDLDRVLKYYRTKEKIQCK